MLPLLPRARSLLTSTLSVPGKKKEFLLYMGGIPAWHDACQDALDGWKGFEVQKAA